MLAPLSIQLHDLVQKAQLCKACQHMVILDMEKQFWDEIMAQPLLQELVEIKNSLSTWTVCVAILEGMLTSIFSALKASLSYHHNQLGHPGKWTQLLGWNSLRPNGHQWSAWIHESLRNLWYGLHDIVQIEYITRCWCHFVGMSSKICFLEHTKGGHIWSSQVSCPL